jgi:CRISPR/Cas system CMR subunit Cmr4 (Cas7 group RAMP superfamily)
MLRDSVLVVQIEESKSNRVPGIEYESRDGRAELRFDDLRIFRVPRVATINTFVYVTVDPLIINANLFI